MAGYGYGWRPYISVAARQRKAAKKIASLRKKGVDIEPVEIEGRKIAKTFWGKAWCDHLESFSDYENRLPRGRTYVRNGSVCHLKIDAGKVEARVAGSELYTVKVKVNELSAAKWQAIKSLSAGKIGSLLELLQGRLSDEVMQIVTNRKDGLFPLSKEISFGCDCPDWAGMCKHIAAVMYGIGARLDSRPELLFLLRRVNHDELIAVDAEAAVSAATKSGTAKRIATDDLSDIFGIELDADKQTTGVAKKRTAKKTTAKKSTARKTSTKKVVPATKNDATRKTVKKKKK